MSVLRFIAMVEGMGGCAWGWVTGNINWWLFGAMFTMLAMDELRGKKR